MRRIAALLEKEVRHHGAATAALFACLAGIYLLLLLLTAVNSEVVTLMQAHAGFLFFAAFGAVVLANRLVVAEYYGRTQLFVEALPIRRFEMVAVKYVLGLAVLVLAAGLSLLVTALASLTREPIDARFLGLVATRSAVFLFFVWSFFFAMGFVGRFRAPIYLGIFMGLVVIEEMTAFEMQHFGPVALLDASTLAVEREVLPIRAVLETLAFGAGATVLAFVLALIREGSVAEMLAQRMSQREKATVGILFIALTLALTFLGERREKKPYAFPEDEVLASGSVPLEVLYLLPERLDDARVLLERLEAELAPLASELGWKRLPEVRIAYGPSLDPGIYDDAELAENEGILVRANFRRTEGWDVRDFSAHVVGRVLDRATRGRARFEPKAWLRDGFAQWWSLQRPVGPQETQLPPESRPDLARACSEGDVLTLRALWTTRHEPPDERRLARWRRYREQHGEALAEAVALSGLRVLEARAGRGAVVSLARSVFGRVPPRDARELFYEWRRPMARVFADATGIAWSELVAGWDAELDRARSAPGCREALAALPEGAASIEVEAGPGTVRDLVYSLRLTAPPAPGTLVALLHTRLTPFDDELERQELSRVEDLWPAGAREASWRLSGLYGRGSRAFFALELDSAVLGCPLRFHAERRVLP